jgi:hypothetical protein
VLPPVTPPTCQDTAVLLELVTVAEKVWVPVPTSTFAEVGATLTCTTGVTVPLPPPPPPPQAAIASTTENATRWLTKRVGQLNLCKPVKHGRINRKSVLPNPLRDSR